MKNLLQDRKILYLFLCIAVVSVFTLSIAYAAMEAVLEIHGNSEVVASSWDIHLDNVKVKTGSVPANAPQISGTSSVGFDVELNTPGDYYEFTVDVVNEGTIDAMIDSVVKTPELTSEQVKYIKYEITYENGESISSKQTLSKGTRTPIKVRVEYRKDLVANDLPSSVNELNLNLTLIYVQSDGSGSSIPNNGAEASLVRVVSGDGTKVGNEVCIKNECFYVISSDDSTVTMLAKMNITLGESPIQSLDSETTVFSSDTQMGEDYSSYIGSIVEGYVNNYNSYLITQGVMPISSRLITYNELISLGCSLEDMSYWNCMMAPDWVYSTSYWTGTAFRGPRILTVREDGGFWDLENTDNDTGVRPVITISRDYL